MVYCVNKNKVVLLRVFYMVLRQQQMAEETSDERNFSTLPVVSNASDDNGNIKMVLPQIFAVIVKNTLMLTTGMTVGFITILIPRVIGNDPNEHFSLTEAQVSWIGSSLSISAGVGSLFSGLIAQPFGRKRVMISITVPFFFTWIILYFAKEVWHLFIALSLSGTCAGLGTAAVCSYISEISQPHVRGMLAASGSVTVIFGVLIEIFLGTFLSWRNAALLSSIIPVIGFTFLWFLPESPCWLLSKNKAEEACKSLAWFRGWTTIDSVKTEFLEMSDSYQNKKEKVPGKFNSTKGFKNVLKPYLGRRFLFPLFLITFLYFASNFTGSATLQIFSVLVFATLDVPINKYYATLIMGCCEFFGCFLSIFFVRCLGKRKMGLLSLSGLIICNTSVGIYAYINNIIELRLKADFENTSLENINLHQWIPLFLLLCISFFGHCGLKGLPWILVGEVFSFETRSIGCGICTSMFSVSGFLGNLVFITMIKDLTFPGVYWFHAAVALVAFIVVCLIVPETEGKTLKEITDHFAGHSKLSNSVRRCAKVHPSVLGKKNLETT